MHTPRPPPEPATIVLVFGGRFERADLPGLCERVRAALEGGSGAEVVLCDVGAAAPDAVTVDALARLQLTARRLGCEVRLRDACGELRALLVLMGLDEVLPLSGGSRFEQGRQPEQREQVRRVQEEGDPGDPSP